MNQQLYERLQEVARAQNVTYYADIAPIVGLDMDSPDDRVRIGELLGEISVFEHQHGRPMLSAIVIHREDNQPGQGFFELARQLGLFRGGERFVFFVQELNRVYDYWRTA